MQRDYPQLRDFDPAHFLRHHWQRRPLLLRHALPNFTNPLSPQELAGLALEPELESRLVAYRDGEWQLQHGPFTEDRFRQLPDRDWTLLVQAVDHVVPAVADLLDYFRFIPNWRIDDVMVSYATVGGSVGPHFDRYDVFLVQGQGERHWQIGEPVDGRAALRESSPLHLLEHFVATEQWTLSAGDILYLPPGVPHWGVSQSNDCMTYSVGFRAPADAEILADFCDEQLSHLDEDQRYTDPGLALQANPGAIAPAAIAEVRRRLLAMLDQPQALERWFGQWATRPKYGDDSPEYAEAAPDWASLEAADTLRRDAAARFAFTDHGDTAILFVNGTDYPLTDQNIDMARQLCAHRQWSGATVKAWAQRPDGRLLLEQLFSQGSLYVDDAD